MPAYSHVIKMGDVIAHDLRGSDRFLGDRNVAGSGGNHRNRSFAVFFLVAEKHNRPRQAAILRPGHALLDRGKLLLADARSQQYFATLLGQARKICAICAGVFPAQTPLPASPPAKR